MYKVYKIENGDTVEDIARKNYTTVDVLYELNGPIGNFSVGEFIVVPNQDLTNFKSYIVKNGDSLYSIARLNNISVDDLAMLNGINKNEYIYPNQELLIPNEGIEIYITKVGDTIKTLTDKFNTNYQTISDQNSKIYLLPEQLIIIKKK